MKNINLYFVLVSVFSLVGCSADYTMDTATMSKNIECSQILKLGIDLEFLDADLDPDVKTTPVHLNDVGLLVGNTVTDISSNIADSLNPVPYAGWYYEVGEKNLKWIGGAMLRLNVVSLSDKYRTGIHGIKKQSSDIRPDNNASFAYTYVEMGAFTIEPDVGVRLNGKDLWCTFKVGFPYSSFEVESGWDRWGKWKKFDSERWSGFGIRPSVEIGSADTSMGILSFRAHYVRYETSFGKIDGLGFSVGTEW